MSGVQESNKIYIKCTGVDQKIHICEPHLKETKCGVKVDTKNVSDRDYKAKFSCYECTF